MPHIFTMVKSEILFSVVMSIIIMSLRMERNKRAENVSRGGMDLKAASVGPVFQKARSSEKFSLLTYGFVNNKSLISGCFFSEGVLGTLMVRVVPWPG